MRIGIIGLLPDQANIIRDEFSHYHIECLPREREREAAEFATRFAKVALMVNFIGHATQDAIPRHKRVLIQGGMSKLRQWLTTQASAVEVKVKPAPKTEPKKVVIERTTDKKTDYTLLLKLNIGEKVSFKRPPHTTMLAFEKQVAGTRSYYRRKHGLVTKASFVDSVCEITVVDKIKPHKTEEAAPRETHVIVEASKTDERREFWKAAFLASLPTVPNVKRAADDADKALAALEARFPEGK